MSPIALIHALNAGDLESDHTHTVLLFMTIAAEFAVAAGIILESEWPKHWRQWTGMGLVIGGVVISAIATVALFRFDEALSTKQQEKIIALDTQNLRLKNAMLPRKIMAGDKFLHWLEELGKAPQNHAVIEVVPDWEAARLAQEIKFILERFGHWQVEFTSTFPQPYIDEGVTLIAYNPATIDVEHPPTMEPSMAALYLLLANTVAINTPPNRALRWYVRQDQKPQLDWGGYVVPTDRVVIVVGARPVTAMVDPESPWMAPNLQ
jgi:hypothetical protein